MVEEKDFADSVDWIVLRDGGAKCLRCGAKLIIELPCIADDWCAAMGSFFQTHKTCVSVEETL